VDVSVYYPLVGAGVPAAELVQQVAHDSTWITTHLTDAIDPPYAQAVIRRLQRAPEARARVEAALTHTDTTTATNWLPARCRAVSVPCRASRGRSPAIHKPVQRYEESEVDPLAVEAATGGPAVHTAPRSP
jgi:hypothetical protein